MLRAKQLNSFQLTRKMEGPSRVRFVIVSCGVLCAASMQRQLRIEHIRALWGASLKQADSSQVSQCLCHSKSTGAANLAL
jgi:hypothetical protein